MENIYVVESTAPLGIIAHMDADQAKAVAKAMQKWLAVKVVVETFDSGADIILQNFANELELCARRA